MVSDLFEADNNSFQRIPLQDAEVSYLPRLRQLPDDRQLLERLVAEVPWKQQQVTVWGKRFVQPRLIAWYGDEGRSYAYSGIRLDPLPWTEVLLRIRDKVQDAVSHLFNSVLLNYYRDHRDSMGFHSDDEPELGDQPVIASLSLGEERTFIMKHKAIQGLKPVRLRLASGSVLLMSGDTQRNWQHGVPKEPRSCGPRLNLTFRQIMSGSERGSAAAR
jgi:alkylated DNA repair dioxygenase AlkB